MRNVLTSWRNIIFTIRPVLQFPRCSVYTRLLHFFLFPFITLSSLFLFHSSIVTILLHFLNLLRLHYDPNTSYSFCNSSTQLQFGPKLLLQPQSLTCLVNLTSSQVYGPIKMPSLKSGSMIHAVKLVHTTGIRQLARGL
jgi:hypothetical protein